MSLQYLHFEIFGMAIMDMASSPGSLRERLSNAYVAYFYKIRWDEDSEVMPDDCKKEFLALKKILHDDLLTTIRKEHVNLRAEYTSLSLSVSDERLGDRSNAQTVIKDFHWTKAKKTATLIVTIYISLGFALR